MVDYYSAYKPYITEYISVSNKKVIEKAHVIRFKYVDDDRDIKLELVLVLNPNYKHKLHGIKLNDLPIPKFKALMNKITTTLPLDEQLGELTIPTDIYKMPIISAINMPTKFYSSYIKNDIRFRMKPPIYRTYDVGKMSNISIVHVKYKKLGLEANYSQDAIDLFPMVQYLND